MNSNAQVVVVGGGIVGVSVAQRRAATVIEHSLYDPNNQSLRA